MSEDDRLDNATLTALYTEDIKIRQQQIALSIQEMEYQKEYASQALEYQNEQMTQQRKSDEKARVYKYGFWGVVFIALLIFAGMMILEGHEDSIRWIFNDLLKVIAGVVAGSGGTVFYLHLQRRQ